MRLPKLLLLPLALLLAGPGVAADLPKNFAIDRTPPLVSNWIWPLDSTRVELVNPFLTPGRTTAPKPLQPLRPPDSSEITWRGWFNCDSDATGKVFGVFRVLFPICPTNTTDRCEAASAAARQIATWRVEPGSIRGEKKGTRVLFGVDFTWEIEDVVTRIVFGPLDADTLPPPIRMPVLSLEELVADPAFATRVEEPFLGGIVPLDTLDRPPTIGGSAIKIRSRRVPLAAFLLAHVTATGTVDRILPAEVEPPIFWPFWKRIVSGWKFEPARGESGPVDCWVQLIVEKGEATISGESTSKVFRQSFPQPAGTTPKP